MKRDFDFRAHEVGIVHGRPWKDAIIKLLEPRSPYRPWQTHGSPAPGQKVAVVLDTDPQSVLTAVGVIGPGGNIDDALAKIAESRGSGLFELSTLNMVTNLGLGQGGYGRDSAQGLARVFDRYIQTSAAMMSGHTTLAAGRILLASGGRCTGCDRYIDLIGENARDRVHVRTIDTQRSDPRDWPAVLCDDCNDRMSQDGFTNFLDFRYSLNPRCPECSAQRTASTFYGMPAGPVEEPWVASMGCCVSSERWLCRACGHQW
jgi:hypothetical protein